MVPSPTRYPLHSEAVAMTSFDLSQLSSAESAEQGAVMEVRHPETGEVLMSDGAPVTITLAGEDSSTYRRALHAAQNRRFGRGNLAKIKAEELHNDNLDMLAACTLAWSNIAYEGSDLPCSRHNALRLYKDDGFRWLVEQVDAFVKDRSHFLPKS